MTGSIHVYEAELAGDEGITRPEGEMPIAWQREQRQIAPYRLSQQFQARSGISTSLLLAVH
jgi:hypothetical protein